VNGILAGKLKGVDVQCAEALTAKQLLVFDEMTTFTFSRIGSFVRNQEKLFMIMSKIDKVINTVVRNIDFDSNGAFKAWTIPPTKWTTKASDP